MMLVMDGALPERVMPMSSQRRVLSVGQCAFDHGQISRKLGQSLGVEVAEEATAEDALATLAQTSFDLILVNRVGASDGAPGVDLIRALKSEPTTADLPVMLVSNYRDAQAEAVALGALPGFGKADLGSAETVKRLQAALEQRPDPT